MQWQISKIDPNTYFLLTVQNVFQFYENDAPFRELSISTFVIKTLKDHLGTNKLTKKWFRR